MKQFFLDNIASHLGEDGPSQMALEDLSMFRSVYGSYVFYPSDAVSMERAVELSANTQGICFIRSSRPATPVIYKNDEVFEIGKSKVVLLTLLLILESLTSKRFTQIEKVSKHRCAKIWYISLCSLCRPCRFCNRIFILA